MNPEPRPIAALEFDLRPRGGHRPSSGGATSTKPRLVEGSATAGGKGGAVHRFFNVPQLTPIPWATREIDRTVVNETACSQSG